MRLCKHGKSALLKNNFKIHTNLKRQNHVYILSSKHTYQPMRVHIVAQLFYNENSEQHFSSHTAYLLNMF